MQDQDKERRRPDGMVETIPAGTRAEEDRRPDAPDRAAVNTADAMGVGTTFGLGGDAEGIEGGGGDAADVGAGLSGGPSDEDGDSVKDGGGI